MDETPSPMTVLDLDTCWNVLRQQEFGRLAYAVDGRVDIAPVNYGVDSLGADGSRIVFRTAEGSKLAAALREPEVVFEVDVCTERAATSVVVRGRARELIGREALRSDQVRLRPWVDSDKSHVVAIDVTEISGRTFALHRPWLRMRLGA